MKYGLTLPESERGKFIFKLPKMLLGQRSPLLKELRPSPFSLLPCSSSPLPLIHSFVFCPLPCFLLSFPLSCVFPFRFLSFLLLLCPFSFSSFLLLMVVAWMCFCLCLFIRCGRSRGGGRAEALRGLQEGLPILEGNVKGQTLIHLHIALSSPSLSSLLPFPLFLPLSLVLPLSRAAFPSRVSHS